MHYIKGFSIIILISFIGEILKEIIPLSIPGSIYGIMIMLIFLSAGIIKLETVKKTAEFLLTLFPIMFIPPAVELMDIWGEVKDMIIPILIITVISTIIVMITTGYLTQKVIENESKGLNKK